MPGKYRVTTDQGTFEVTVGDETPGVGRPPGMGGTPSPVPGGASTPLNPASNPLSIPTRALVNLPRSLQNFGQAAMQGLGPTSGPTPTRNPKFGQPGEPEWNFPSPMESAKSTLKGMAHMVAHPLESFAEDPVGTLTAGRAAFEGVAGIARNTPEIGAAASGAGRGAFEAAKEPATMHVRGLPLSIPVPAPVAGGAAGATAGHFIAGHPGAVAGGIIGGLAPVVRGAFRGAKEGLSDLATQRRPPRPPRPLSRWKNIPDPTPETAPAPLGESELPSGRVPGPRPWSPWTPKKPERQPPWRNFPEQSAPEAAPVPLSEPPELPSGHFPGPRPSSPWTPKRQPARWRNIPEPGAPEVAPAPPSDPKLPSGRVPGPRPSAETPSTFPPEAQDKARKLLNDVRKSHEGGGGSGISAEEAKSFVDEQRKQFFSMLREKGLPSNEIRTRIKEVYKGRGYSDLTPGERTKLYKYIQKHGAVPEQPLDLKKFEDYE
jgi:hypothetical protein